MSAPPTTNVISNPRLTATAIVGHHALFLPCSIASPVPAFRGIRVFSKSPPDVVTPKLVPSRRLLKTMFKRRRQSVGPMHRLHAVGLRVFSRTATSGAHNERTCLQYSVQQ